MQSQSVLTQGIQDFSSMSKGDVSKTLFGQIQWEEITRSGVFLSHIEHQLLERAQANLDITLDNPTEARNFSKILLNIAENCKTNLTVQQYVFTRVEEVLGLGLDFTDADADAYGSKHAPLFTNDGVNIVEASFLKAMQSADPYLQKSAALSFACLLTVCQGNEGALVSWVLAKLSSNVLGSWEIALPVLTTLCRKQSIRERFVFEGGVSHVKNILKGLGTNGNAQSIYELVFVLWTLSLGPNVDTSRFLSAGIVPFLVELASAGTSRKVVRMSIGTLKNLADTQCTEVLTEMLTVGVERLIESISQSPKGVPDPEFESDLKALAEVMAVNYRELSTFERWASQVQSGNLRSGVVHQEKFWRENARLVDADDFKLLRRLITFLKHDDPETIKLALFDLGEFARFYPNGRSIVNTLGGKDVALELMSSADADLSAKALQCVSKLMVTKWEFMK